MRKSASGTASLPRNIFAQEAAPALTSFAHSSPAPFVDGIKAAREHIVARTDEDRETFLRKRRFSKAETGRIIETVLSEEGRPPESIFDFVQGMTAHARTKAHQDTRLELEGRQRPCWRRRYNQRRPRRLRGSPPSGFAPSENFAPIQRCRSAARPMRRHGRRSSDCARLAIHAPTG